MLDIEQRDRLIKLIRLMSSDHDGEALGAVRGVGRILASAGLSFHELAEALAGRIIEVVVEKIRVVEVNPKQDWLDACERILGVKGRRVLKREREFVEDIRQRFTLDPRFKPSEKQTNWFVSIHQKYV